jgi:hypothetical protein
VLDHTGHAVVEPDTAILVQALLDLDFAFAQLDALCIALLQV